MIVSLIAPRGVTRYQVVWWGSVAMTIRGQGSSKGGDPSCSDTGGRSITAAVSPRTMQSETREIGTEFAEILAAKGAQPDSRGRRVGPGSGRLRRLLRGVSSTAHGVHSGGGGDRRTLEASLPGACHR